MLEALFNLILTGVFLQSRVNEQMLLSNLSTGAYHLPHESLLRLETVAPQRAGDPKSLGVAVTAKSCIVIDERTNKVLYQKNPLEKRSIASLTKLMTALVAADYFPDWSQTVTILPADYRSGGISYLISGDQVSVHDLFYTALVASSNEAAAALARATGLNEADFIKAMNDKAVALGMTNTKFTDATGLDTGNASTAADIALLIQGVLEKPNLRQVISSQQYTLAVENKGRVKLIENTDKILGQEFGTTSDVYRVEAGKTGYLDQAGYCFASRVSDQKKNRIITVVLGSESIDSRFNDTKSLAFWVFNNYQWQ